MPLLSVQAMNDSLDNDYASHSHQHVLFFSDPALEADPADVELAGGGYARKTITTGDWAAAADGSKTTTGPLTQCTATAAWADEATHYGLWDVTESCWRDSGPLNAPLEVLGAGPVSVWPRVFYDDAVTVATTEG